MSFDDVKYFLKKVGYTIYDKRADIAFFGGMGLTVGGTVMMVKATNDIQPWFQEHRARMNAIDADTEMSEEEKKKNRREINRQTLFKLLKVYSLPVIIEAGGLAAEIYAHSELKSDLAETGAALSAVTVAYEGLKSRIISAEGEEKWREYAYGDKVKTSTIVDMQTGEVSEEVSVDYGATDAGLYSFLFYEPNIHFSKVKGINRRFLLLTLDNCNRELASKGVMTLHRVLELLGADIFIDCGEKTSKAGWVYRNPDGSTNSIDFGLNSNDEATRRFMRDEENSVRLEFNCVPNVYKLMRLELKRGTND